MATLLSDQTVIDVLEHLSSTIGKLEKLARFLEGMEEEEEEEEFWLLWPTNWHVMTQAFGANPAVYRKWGLPGHEGVDMKAPRGSDIFACAPGRVYRVQETEGEKERNPYGIHVRIEHRLADDRVFKTVYAHLLETKVKVGQQVERGEVIGLADDTGNSRGNHLHLTLKKMGATAAGETNYPGDIIDPTEFLR